MDRSIFLKALEFLLVEDESSTSFADVSARMQGSKITHLGEGWCAFRTPCEPQLKSDSGSGISSKKCDGHGYEYEYCVFANSGDSAGLDPAQFKFSIALIEFEGKSEVKQKQKQFHLYARFDETVARIDEKLIVSFRMEGVSKTKKDADIAEHGEIGDADDSAEAQKPVSGILKFAHVEMQFYFSIESQSAAQKAVDIVKMKRIFSEIVAAFSPNSASSSTELSSKIEESDQEIDKVKGKEGLLAQYAEGRSMLWKSLNGLLFSPVLGVDSASNGLILNRFNGHINTIGAIQCQKSLKRVRRVVPIVLKSTKQERRSLVKSAADIISAKTPSPRNAVVAGKEKEKEDVGEGEGEGDGPVDGSSLAASKIALAAGEGEGIVGVAEVFRQVCECDGDCAMLSAACPASPANYTRTHAKRKTAAVGVGSSGSGSAGKRSLQLSRRPKPTKDKRAKTSHREVEGSRR